MESPVRCDPDCTALCQSTVHGCSIGKAVLAQVPDEAVAAFLVWLCRNFAKSTDDFGRTALHFAASCGKVKLAEWLILHGHSNPNAKDRESGWTPLHRSLYYGHLNVAAALVKHGASITAVDVEGVSPLDLVLKDRVQWDCRADCPPKGPAEVYAWGCNLNYNLGFENQHGPDHPEVVESLRRIKTNIIDVAMSKFHTVFLGSNGQIFSCGHGHGGRLGHSSDHPCVYPKLVTALSGESCTRVAIARDHTVMLMENGSIWTCGLNRHHQLGHVPPPSFLHVPKNIRIGSCAKTLHGHEILDVCAGKYHTVAYSSNTIFTCGLNGGQLGQSRESSQSCKLQTNLTAVSGFNLYDAKITIAAASDGATVFATSKGDIYLLHEYTCCKIAARQGCIFKMNLIGGHLNPNVDVTNVLKDKGSIPLKLVVLGEKGKIYIWTRDCLGELQLLRCLFTLDRTLCVADFALHHQGILLITTEGEGFKGTFSPFDGMKLKNEQQGSRRKHRTFSGTDSFIQKKHYTMIDLQRLPSVYRALKIACDPKGKNSMVIQSDPITCLWGIPEISSSEMRQHMDDLLYQADICDAIHDVVFQAGSRRYPAHRFILASRCNLLPNLDLQKSSKGHEPVVVKTGLKPQILEQLLQFAYTDNCDLLRDGQHVPWLLDDDDENEPKNLISAEEGNKKNHIQSRVPLKRVKEAAKKAGMASLHIRLSDVVIKDSVVTVSAVNRPGTLKFIRRAFPQFSDVCIISKDGKTFPCHKCVLVARLEYFYSMLVYGWMEAMKTSAVSIPLPGAIIEAVLEYIYTDSSPKISASRDASYICNVMIVADQFLAWRLKEQCQEALAPLLTLKNVTELLEIADFCNATQLKSSCLEFISHNLANILETEELCMMDESILEDLGRSYRNVILRERSRAFAPFRRESICAEDVTNVGNAFPVNLTENYSTFYGESPPQPESPKPQHKQCVGVEDFQTVDGGKRSRHRLNKSEITPTETEPQSKTVCKTHSPKENNESGPKLEMRRSAPIPIPSSSSSSLPLQSPTSAEVSPLWGDSEFPDLSAGIRRKETGTRSGGDFGRIKKTPQKQLRKSCSESPRPITQSQFNSWSNGISSAKDNSQKNVLRKQPVLSPTSFSWGLCGSQQYSRQQLDGPSRSQNKSISPTVQSPPKNPWTKNVTDSNPDTSFTTILKEEKVRVEKLARDMVKPLHVIQLEDRAIEELLLHYGAANNTEEFITVERIIPDAVAPIWKCVKANK